MNRCGRVGLGLDNGLVRGLASGAVALALCAASQAAFAQVQDDARLAEEPEEQPTRRSTTRRESPGGYPGATSSGASATEETNEPELPPALTTAELRAEYADLEVRTVPLPLLSVGFSSIYPFVTLGLGVGYDAYLSPRLRLDAAVSVGGSLILIDRWAVGFYAEGSLGFVVLRSASETETELKPLLTADGRKFHSKRSGAERFLYGPEEPPPGSFVRALVPTQHSLELEAGAFSGTYPFHRCTADCAGEPLKHQNEAASRLVPSLFAGLRYVYFRWARSARAPFVTRYGLEATVDAIVNPFWRDDPSLLNLSDSHPGHSPVGGRVRIRLPTLKCGPSGSCFGFDVMAGYLPAPSDGLLSVNLVFQ